MKHRFLLTVCALVLAARASGGVVLEADGAESALKDNLLARLSLKAEPCDAPIWRVRRLFARAEKEMDPALRAFGFYRSKVEKSLTTEGDCWQARFTIALGPRLPSASAMSWYWAMRAATSDWPRCSRRCRCPRVPCSIMRSTKTSRSGCACSLPNVVTSTSNSRVNSCACIPMRALAEIDIEAQSGPRYRFGELRFSEQALDEDFVRKLARPRRANHFMRANWRRSTAASATAVISNG